jgi:hypothetical protein
VAVDYFFKGKQQTEIAIELGVSSSWINMICAEYRNSPVLKDRLRRSWEKEISMVAKGKALQVAESINPDKIPDGSKAQTVGILIDKARLIDGESTANIAYIDMSRSLHELEAEERGLRERLGMGDDDAE